MKKLIALILLLPSLALAQDGNSRIISVTPTIQAAAYVAGDVIGGKLTFSNALQTMVGSGYLVSVTVSDLAAQAVDLDLVVFKSDPSNTTFTENSALDIADADLSKVLTVVNLGSSSRFAFADNSVHHISSLAVPLQGVSATTSGISGNLYGVLVSRGAPTFASTSDLTISIGVSRD